MRYILVITAFLFGFAACNQEAIQLEQKGIMYFEAGTTLAFTGECTENYPNGTLKYKGKFKEGLKEGTWQYFYDTEQLAIEETFAAGISTGNRKVFTETGEFVSE